MTAAAPLRRDAAANRERILAAAIDVFSTSGADAGIDEIARKAGVGVGTVYRRFPTKEALVQAITAQLLRDLLVLARRALDVPAAEGLATFLAGAGDLQARHAGCLWQLWSSGPESDEIRGDLRQGVQRVLVRGRECGAVRDDLTYEDVAMVLWSLAGVVESVRDVQPDLWRRTLEVLLLGLRPTDAALQSPPLRPGGLDEVSLQTSHRRGRQG